MIDNTHRLDTERLNRIGTNDLAPLVIETDQPEDVLWVIGVSKSSELPSGLAIAASVWFRPFPLQLNAPVLKLVT